MLASLKYLVFFQEEREAQAKADKIKLALEKLKEAKVKKVSLKIMICFIRAVSQVFLIIPVNNNVLTETASRHFVVP